MLGRYPTLWPTATNRLTLTWPTVAVELAALGHFNLQRQVGQEPDRRAARGVRLAGSQPHLTHKASPKGALIVGGFGSGDHNAMGAAICKTYHSIDFAWLRRRGMLQLGRYSSLIWWPG